MSAALNVKNPAPSRVMVSTLEYERSHGKTPRGFGSWAFFPYRDSRIESAFWSHRLPYGQAKKEAQVHFAAAGINLISVGS